MAVFSDLLNPLKLFRYAPLWGHVAEWLRSGLQIRVFRFDSGRGLQYFFPLLKNAPPRAATTRRRWGAAPPW